jgi:hypothetical protein
VIRNQSRPVKFKFTSVSEKELSQNILLKKQEPEKRSESWITGYRETPVSFIPVITSALNWKDHAGAWKVRWGLNRMNYRVLPGLYACGSPGPDSPVMVSANYKLSFDRLRASLNGIDAWILVLDTKGVNVWCAAGKGTFGTAELVRQIRETRLNETVNHNTLIIPQLGATGVRALEVTKETGFKVRFGPVRCEDIPLYLKNGLIKTQSMKQVVFPLRERMAVAPMEIVQGLMPFGIILLLALLTEILLIRRADSGLLFSLIPPAAGFISGTVLFPALLPWLPGRSFAWKGYLLGHITGGILILLLKPDLSSLTLYLFLLPVISSYAALNFTGASTFASVSGTRRELRIALPLLIASLAIAVILKALLIVRLFLPVH